MGIASTVSGYTDAIMFFLSPSAKISSEDNASFHILDRTKPTRSCFTTLQLTRFSGVPRNFVRRGGGSTNSFEDRENRDLGAVAPYSVVLEAAVIWYKKFHFK